MLVDAALRALVRGALQEDVGTGDLSTREFLPRRLYRARLLAKQDGVLCGRAVFMEVLRQAAPRARARWRLREGASFKAGRILAELAGPRELLTAERTALNFLQRLCGIATLTRAYAREVRGTRARVYDTRKTLPGWRALDKYAVRVGGGRNHRMGLHDMLMLKDNHLEALGEPLLPRLRPRLKSFRRRRPGVPVALEAKTHAEAALAAELGADIVMLDNMPASRLRREIRFLRRAAPRARTEITGGVTLASLRRLARLGPDRISIGRLTHSAPALDLSLELER